jgi:MFS family permease
MASKNEPLPTPMKSIKFIVLQVVIYVLFGLGPFTVNVIQVLLNKLSMDFNASKDIVIISISAFMFPFAIVQLFSGAISEVKGRIPVILVGLIIFGASMLVATFANSVVLYMISNMLGGIGFGLANPVLIALMADITPRGPSIAKRMGYMSASVNLSIGLGPFIAAQIMLVNWHLIYVLLLVITLASMCCLLLVKSTKNMVNDHPKTFSIKTQLAEELRRSIVLLMIICSFLNGATVFATSVWTSRDVAGKMNSSSYGGILGIYGIVSAIASIILGNVIKKKGPRVALFLGWIPLDVGLVILAFPNDVAAQAATPNLVFGLALVGIAAGSIFPVIMFFSQTVSIQRRGVLAGLITFGYFTGIALVTFIYEPLFLAGGITTVYVGIIVVSVVLIVLMNLLITKATRSPASNQEEKPDAVKP